jgi:hypothetical protein
MTYSLVDANILVEPSAYADVKMKVAGSYEDMYLSAKSLGNTSQKI